MTKPSTFRRVIMTAMSMAVAFGVFFFPAFVSLRFVLDRRLRDWDIPGTISSWHRQVSRPERTEARFGGLVTEIAL